MWGKRIYLKMSLRLPASVWYLQLSWRSRFKLMPRSFWGFFLHRSSIVYKPPKGCVCESLCKNTLNKNDTSRAPRFTSGEIFAYATVFLTAIRVAAFRFRGWCPHTTPVFMLFSPLSPIFHSYRHKMAYSSEKRNGFVPCVQDVLCAFEHGDLGCSLTQWTLTLRFPSNWGRKGNAGIRTQNPTVFLLGRWTS